MKFKTESWYYIKFLDHTFGDSKEVTECEIIGKFHSRSKHHLRFIVWDNLHPEFKDNNQEFVNIIESTITKKKKIAL